VRDIELVIKSKHINSDLLVIGGDTIFTADFNFDFLYQKYCKLDFNFVLTYEVEDTTKYGIAEVNKDNLIVSFLEKPHPSQTKARTACPCFYMFRPQTLKLIEQYVSSSHSLQEVDAPGTFIAWLYQFSPIYASPVRRRFDIGSLPTYIEANDYYYGYDGQKTKDEQGKISQAASSRSEKSGDRTTNSTLESTLNVRKRETSNAYVILGLLVVTFALIKWCR